MLAVSPLFPGFEWEYPISIGTQQEQALDCMHFDNIFLPNSSSIQPQTDQDRRDCDRDRDCDYDCAHHFQQGKSSHSSSSVDDLGATILAKKLNHNASERERRKKINVMYSTLSSLLPNTDHKKKLSIPTTINQVLKYIPELQKEVEELIHKKDELLSKVSSLQQGDDQREISSEEKLKEVKNLKEKQLSSISINKLGEKEIMIQISSYDKLPLAEVLLLLENDGLLVINVSTSQSFGGRALYNLHLWMDGTTISKHEVLNEQLLSLIEKTSEG